MRLGTLYGIGIGPGDPELITLKGARILGNASCVYVPRAPRGEESLALSIAKEHVNPAAKIIPVEFSMTLNETEREAHWLEITKGIAEVLETGKDACYLTLGDTLLYSTYVYMLRALRQHLPGATVVTVPGVASFSAAAALCEFPLGESDLPVTIVPATDDLFSVRTALSAKGTVVLMKVGKRLQAILDMLEDSGLIDTAVFISRAGLQGQRIETDLRLLRGQPIDAGNLSVILIRGQRERR